MASDNLKPLNDALVNRVLGLVDEYDEGRIGRGDLSKMLRKDIEGITAVYVIEIEEEDEDDDYDDSFDEYGDDDDDYIVRDDW